MVRFGVCFVKDVWQCVMETLTFGVAITFVYWGLCDFVYVLVFCGRVCVATYTRPEIEVVFPRGETFRQCGNGFNHFGNVARLRVQVIALCVAMCYFCCFVTGLFIFLYWGEVFVGYVDRRVYGVILLYRVGRYWRGLIVGWVFVPHFGLNSIGNKVCRARGGPSL